MSNVSFCLFVSFLFVFVLFCLFLFSFCFVLFFLIKCLSLTIGLNYT